MVVPTKFLGNVAQRVPHEGRELGCVVDTKQGLQVIAHDRQREDATP